MRAVGAGHWRLEGLIRFVVRGARPATFSPFWSFRPLRALIGIGSLTPLRALRPLWPVAVLGAAPAVQRGQGTPVAGFSGLAGAGLGRSGTTAWLGGRVDGRGASPSRPVLHGFDDLGLARASRPGRRPRPSTSRSRWWVSWGCGARGAVPRRPSGRRRARPSPLRRHGPRGLPRSGCFGCCVVTCRPTRMRPTPRRGPRWSARGPWRRRGVPRPPDTSGPCR
jgi:hypothetical protein